MEHRGKLHEGRGGRCSSGCGLWLVLGREWTFNSRIYLTLIVSLRLQRRALGRNGWRASAAIEIIERLSHQPLRIPSPKWPDRIKRSWEVDPLLCLERNHEIRIVSLINDLQVIARISRHVGVRGSVGSPFASRPAQDRWRGGVIERGHLLIEPWHDDPSPDYACRICFPPREPRREVSG